jgi:hypothetical protein
MEVLNMSNNKVEHDNYKCKKCGKITEETQSAVCKFCGCCSHINTEILQEKRECKYINSRSWSTCDRCMVNVCGECYGIDEVIRCKDCGKLISSEEYYN